MSRPNRCLSDPNTSTTVTPGGPCGHKKSNAETKSMVGDVTMERLGRVGSYVVLGVDAWRREPILDFASRSERSTRHQSSMTFSQRICSTFYLPGVRGAKSYTRVNAISTGPREDRNN